MGVMPLDKTYDEAADALMGHVKDAARTEGEENGQRFIEVVGIYEVFDMYEMDTWGGKLKFVFRDTRPKNDDEVSARGEVAMLVPQLAVLMTSTATLQVFRETKRKVTQTITENGRVLERDNVVQDETLWVDVTREFAKRGERQRSFHRGEDW